MREWLLLGNLLINKRLSSVEVQSFCESFIVLGGPHWLTRLWWYVCLLLFLRYPRHTHSQASHGLSHTTSLTPSHAVRSPRHSVLELFTFLRVGGDTNAVVLS